MNKTANKVAAKCNAAISVKPRAIKIKWVEDGINNEMPIWKFNCLGHKGIVVRGYGNGTWSAKLDQSGNLNYESAELAKADAEKWLRELVEARIEKAKQYLKAYTTTAVHA